MTSDHTHPYKGYAGNAKTKIACTISTYFLFQKLLSTVFLIVVCGTYLLFTAKFSCDPNKSLPKTEAAEPVRKVPRLPNYVGTVTILDMDGPVAYTMVNHSLRYQVYQNKKSKYKQSLSKIVKKSLSKIRCNIDLNNNQSDRVGATHPIDDTIPNWESYGITPFMPCQRSILDDQHTFSLDLNGAAFQNGETLDFILTKDNRSPVDLVKHLLKKYASWPDQPDTCMHIKDYWILPGIVRKHRLESKHSLDSSTDLKDYTNVYCYLKQGLHYCFIPLKTIVPVVQTGHPRSMPFFKETSKSMQSSQSSLDSGIDIESALSLKQSEPLEALPKGNDVPTKDRPINSNTNGVHRQPSLSEELIAADDNRHCRKKVHPHVVSPRHQDAKIFQKMRQALSEALRNVETLKGREKNVTELIQQAKIGILNDATKNKISLSWSNKIQLALSEALEAIRSLKSSLMLEKEYQLGMQNSSPVTLSDQRRTVIQKSENLEEAVYEEYVEALSAEALLTQVIESLEVMYDLLFDIRKLLSGPDKMVDIRRNVKKLFNGNVKAVQEGITQLEKLEKLEQMEDDQLSMIRGCRKTIPEIEETLTAIQKDLVTSIRNRLEVVGDKIDSSDLKRLLKLESNIIEGKVKNRRRIEEIITDLELKEEDIQEILDERDVSVLKIEKTKEIEKNIENAIDKALDLKKKLKAISSKANTMVDQEKVLEDLLNTMNANYNFE